MAKTTKTTSEESSKGKALDFNTLGDFLSKEANVKGSLIDDNEYVKVNYHISTGSYMLNALISGSIYKGVPGGRIVAFGGKPGTGKTYFALNIAREAQKIGNNIIYIDTEGAITPEAVVAFGCDPSTFRIEPISTMEGFKTYMTKLLDKLEKAQASGMILPKITFFLDSIGMLASEKEIEDANNGEIKADFSINKQAKSLFRIISSRLNTLDYAMIINSHTYDSMSMYGGEIWGGGQGFAYSCSGMFRLTKAKLEGDTDEMDLGKIGQITTVYADKNRFVVPKKVKIPISFKGATNPFSGLEFFCTIDVFNKVGIFKGKYSVDKETGEESIKEGGNFWYVRHLDKSVSLKNLFTSEIFTKEVLNAIDSIAMEYFSYGNVGENIDEYKSLKSEFKPKEDEIVNPLANNTELF